MNGRNKDILDSFITFKSSLSFKVKENNIKIGLYY